MAHDQGFFRMEEWDLSGKRVLIRVDFNVPFSEGVIADDSRIRAALPTLKRALEQGARILLLSHRGRPKEGVPDPECSLRPVADHLAGMLGRPVRFEMDWLDGVSAERGEVVLCENVRFLVGEKANDEALARRMAALCDIFVMDAFGAAHRAHASTEGIIRFAPAACAGPLLAAELDALAHALDAPVRPVVAIVGGAKVSTKLEVLEHLLDIVDTLVVGGGIANTFLAAAGKPVGTSLYERDLVSVAGELLQKAQRNGCDIPLPDQVICATEATAAAPAFVRGVDEVEADEMILDLAPACAERLAGLIRLAGTVIWNGPVGLFEVDQFGQGTKILAEAIAASGAYSLAGGGDTLAAIAKYGVQTGISYTSTGGGAFLECIEGKILPAVAALRARC